MSELNEQQSRAVLHIEGPLLVLAGAGSGKTRVVIHRIAHLLEIGIPPAEILAVTFTNKAAEEMRNRIRNLKNAFILASTFHSLGSRILRESIHHLGYETNFSIYDEDDSEKLLKSIFQDKGLSAEKGPLKEARSFISRSKNDLLTPEQSGSGDLLSSLYQSYQEKLKECHAVDFDDLLFLTVHLLQSHPSVLEMYQNRWRFLLIDEYQDTNFAQYTLAKLLSASHHNIFAVGDPDQSIYSWRGARYQNILNFSSDFPGATIITLDQNYRSTTTILEAANALIEHNENRFKKHLWSSLGEGDKIGLYTAMNEKQEASFVAMQINQIKRRNSIGLNEMAIFYRTNAQSRPFEDALLSQKIPYTIIGGVSFYQRKEIKDLLAYLRLIVSEADLISFLRTINLPKRGLGPSTLDKIVAAAQEHQRPILSFCRSLLEDPNLAPGLKLGPKAKQGLSDYLSILDTLRKQQPYLSLSDLLKETITRTRYLSYLQEDKETEQDKKENIDELLAKAIEWEQEQESPSLTQFLEELSLKTSSREDPEIPTVKMMTLHNSKGLEFPIVFFVGLEEDLLPHINSKDDASAVEEERRLCYVGMTRAKRKLYLTHAVYRYMWGTERYMRPSRFLKEIPAEYTEKKEF